MERELPKRTALAKTVSETRLAENLYVRRSGLRVPNVDWIQLSAHDYSEQSQHCVSDVFLITESVGSRTTHRLFFQRFPNCISLPPAGNVFTCMLISVIWSVDSNRDVKHMCFISLQTMSIFITVICAGLQKEGRMRDEKRACLCLVIRSVTLNLWTEDDEGV